MYTTTEPWAATIGRRYASPEDAKRRPKDFDDENLHEKAAVLGVRQGATAARHAHANAASKEGNEGKMRGGEEAMRGWRALK